MTEIERIIEDYTYGTVNKKGLAKAIKDHFLSLLPEEKEEIDYVDCGTYETCRKEGFNQCLQQIRSKINGR